MSRQSSIYPRRRFKSVMSGYNNTPGTEAPGAATGRHRRNSLKTATIASCANAAKMPTRKLMSITFMAPSSHKCDTDISPSRQDLYPFSHYRGTIAMKV